MHKSVKLSHKPLHSLSTLAKDHAFEINTKNTYMHRGYNTCNAEILKLLPQR